MNVEKKYPAGSTTEGEVFKFTPYGAFIKVDENIYGLIHVSKFGDTQTMKELLKDKTKYQFIIESVSPQDRRLMLTLKDLEKQLAKIGKTKEKKEDKIETEKPEVNEAEQKSE